MVPEDADPAVDRPAQGARREAFVDLLVQQQGALVSVDATANVTLQRTACEEGLVSQGGKEENTRYRERIEGETSTRLKKGRQCIQIALCRMI